MAFCKSVYNTINAVNVLFKSIDSNNNRKQTTSQMDLNLISIFVTNQKENQKELDFPTKKEIGVIYYIISQNQCLVQIEIDGQ